jgi:hypothetical protein
MISRVERVSLVRALICAVLVLGCSSAANAEDGKEGDDSWNIVLAPYLWGISLDGKTAIGRLPPVDIDAPFSDIWDALNIGGSLHTEFRKGKWNFVIDPTYLDLELDTPPQDVTLPPIPPGTNVTVSGKMTMKMWFVEGWTSYLVAPGWEILGGVRWQSQDIDIKLNDSSLPPSTDQDWTDFFAGARYSTALGQKWTLNLRGDYAVAGDSESGSWNGIVMFNRRFGETMALNLGYRYFANEYKTGSGADRYLWDVKISGPIVGYTWQFGGTRWPR